MTMLRNFFALLAICALVSVASTSAQAQGNKKLAKELVGLWKLDDMDMSLGASATEEQKAEFEAGKAMMAAMIAPMKGKITFDLKADGSYIGTSPNEDGMGEEKGTWKLVGDKLTMASSNEGSSPEEFIVSIEKGVLNMAKSNEEAGEMPMKITMKFIK